MTELTSAQLPNDAVLAVYLLNALLSVVALWLLRTSWRTHKKKVVAFTNSYNKFETEVAKAELTTQRMRYGKIFAACVLAFVALTVNARLQPALVVLLAPIRSEGSTLGWISSVYELLPLLVLLLSMSAVTYVFLRPAAVKKKIMFGEFKGYYVIDNPESRRYGTARREIVYD